MKIERNARVLCWDETFIDQQYGVRVEQHKPVKKNIALRCDDEWEGVHNGYAAVMKTDDGNRLYYCAHTGRFYADGTADWGKGVLCVAESKDGGEKRRKILYALSVTFFSSLVFAIGLFFFAEQGVGVLFSNLSPFEKRTLVRLVKILSLSAIFHSCAQTLSACLTAQGKPLHSAISLTISVVVRLILDFILVKNAKISIFGCAISANIGYFVAFFIDLVYNMRCSKGKKTGKGVGYDNGSELGRRERRFDGERKKRGAFR